MEVPEKRMGVIFCSYKGKWKEELEEANRRFLEKVRKLREDESK